MFSILYQSEMPECHDMPIKIQGRRRRGGEGTRGGGERRGEEIREDMHEEGVGDEGMSG